MTLPGGKKGLLVNSTNLCAKPIKAIIRIKAQNGRKTNSKPKLRTPCGKGKKRYAQSLPGYLDPEAWCTLCVLREFLTSIDVTSQNSDTVTKVVTGGGA